MMSLFLYIPNMIALNQIRQYVDNKIDYRLFDTKKPLHSKGSQETTLVDCFTTKGLKRSNMNKNHPGIVYFYHPVATTI